MTLTGLCDTLMNQAFPSFFCLSCFWASAELCFVDANTIIRRGMSSYCRLISVNLLVRYSLTHLDTHTYICAHTQRSHHTHATRTHMEISVACESAGSHHLLNGTERVQVQLKLDNTFLLVPSISKLNRWSYEEWCGEQNWDLCEAQCSGYDTWFLQMIQWHWYWHPKHNHHWCNGRKNHKTTEIRESHHSKTDEL